MPYILKARREPLRSLIEKIVSNVGLLSDIFAGETFDTDLNRYTLLVSRIITRIHSPLYDRSPSYIGDRCVSPVDKLAERIRFELVRRSRDNEDICGAVNYCVSLLLWSVTDIKNTPSYFKVDWVNGVFELVKSTVMAGSSRVLSICSVGNLSCAQFEFYRRFASGYEDKKISLSDNGDIV